MNFIEDLKNKYQNGNLAIKLIFINVAVFLLVAILQAIFKSFPIADWLALDGNWKTLLSKPWSIFTYMFMHEQPMHLLFNMLMLYVLGQFFYRYFGDKAFAKFYLIGGVFGGIFYLILNFIYPQNPLIGASAATYAVLFAMVAYQPDLRVRLLFFNEPVKLLHIALGFLALGFLLNANNLGGNISHVGGALFGYFYMKQFEKGKSLFGDFSNPFKKVQKKSKLRAEKKKKQANTPPRDDYDYADWKKNKEDKTNRILEKISRSGYNSLTAAEKEFLFQQGKK